MSSADEVESESVKWLESVLLTDFFAGFEGHYSNFCASNQQAAQVNPSQTFQQPRWYREIEKSRP